MSSTTAPMSIGFRRYVEPPADRSRRTVAEAKQLSTKCPCRAFGEKK